jgi:hypothetical protein
LRTMSSATNFSVCQIKKHHAAVSPQCLHN